jgi:hypothetical protein
MHLEPLDILYISTESQLCRRTVVFIEPHIINRPLPEVGGATVFKVLSEKSCMVKSHLLVMLRFVPKESIWQITEMKHQVSIRLLVSTLRLFALDQLERPTER